MWAKLTPKHLLPHPRSPLVKAVLGPATLTAPAMRRPVGIPTRPSMSAPRRFIIDCDPGVDDAIALLMCLRECGRLGFQILGVTACFGNVNQAQVQINICKILDSMEASNGFFCSRSLPVYPGAQGPLLSNSHDYKPWHGVDGLGDSNLPLLPDSFERHMQKEHASCALLRLSEEYNGEITLVVLGPMTNVALACRLDPAFPTRIKELVWMGGTTYAKGNVTLTSEFNVHKCPESVHIVLSAFPKSTMVSWELTRKHHLPWDKFDDFLSRAVASDTPQGRFIKAITYPFIRDRHVFDGAVICDAICMGISLDPTIETGGYDVFVDVELAGTYCRGQTVIDWSKMSGNPANVRVVDEINLQAFHAMLLRVVEEGSEHTKQA